MGAKTEKRGRPRKDPTLSIRGGVILQPRFPRAIYPQIEAAAEVEGLKVSAFVREAAIRAARRTLRRSVA